MARLDRGAALRLITSDGIDLHAQHRPGPDSRVCLVLAHGFTNCTRTKHVRLIADGLPGVGVFTFDLRGHGRSGGFSTVGDAEVHDVDTAVAAARRLGYQKVVTCGFSLGGTCVIRQAAGQGGSDLPDAAIAVSPLARWWYRDTPAMRRVLYAIEKAPGRAFARYAMGTRISAAEWVDPLPKSPVECIKDVDVPLLIVYGDADQYFPVAHGEDLRAASRHAELWIEPGMGHGEKAVTPGLLRRLTTWAQQA